MIASVRGTVQSVRLDGAVIEVGGVGLLVHATPDNPASPVRPASPRAPASPGRPRPPPPSAPAGCRWSSPR